MKGNVSYEFMLYPEAYSWTPGWVSSVQKDPFALGIISALGLGPSEYLLPAALTWQYVSDLIMHKLVNTVSAAILDFVFFPP